MRILHLIPSLIHGGAQRQLSYLAPQLSQMGHEVHIACSAHGPNRARLQNSGVRLHNLRKRNNYDPNILRQLIRLIQRIKPDLIQTCLLQADVLGGIAAWVTRTPWVLREPASIKGYRMDLKNSLRIAAARGVSAIVANSRGGELYWRTLLPKKNIYVIPNALPIAELEGAPRENNSDHGRNPRGKIVLFVGRFDQQKYAGGLAHQKNIDNLVAALNLVSTPGVVGRLCGDGPRLPLIRQMVEQLGMADRVHLPGFVENPWSLMKQADVFVSVSWFEGNPNTVLEAMACGCPLVVSDIPEHREFLDQESALLVNPSDPRDIAMAIEETLSAPTEARRRARIAQTRARQWDVMEIARRYQEVYLKVLAQR
jgi:glycosyltransferase involved in cell wall biosynthesis